MKVKKMSYIVLLSDLYLLLALAYIIYGSFFTFTRMGHESFTITTISDTVAIIISISEIFLAFLLSYLLHKCYKNSFRYTSMLVTIFNISYRVLNIIALPSYFSGIMLFIAILLLINLLFY